jgi:hypothetical protein
MKTSKSLTKNKFLATFLFVSLITLPLMESCKSEKKDSAPESAAEKIEDIPEKKDNVIEIITENMDFQMKDTIPSGWNTFRYKNESTQTHFVLIDDYPEGKTSEDAEKVVGPVFDRAMKLISEGKTEEGYAEFGNLPEWFSEVVFLGGVGLLSPGQVAQTTIHLKPGAYLMECYVKMENGIFHTSMGMTKDIVVSETDSGNPEPTADIEIEISGTDGIVIKDSIGPGPKTFSVLYKDQKAHENFVGHDVNLVKIEEGGSLEALESWMNWADPKGLIEPAPAGITFMGGTNDMPAGSKGYFHAELEPGNYVLISEVPAPSTKNMMKTFIVGSN